MEIFNTNVVFDICLCINIIIIFVILCAHLNIDVCVHYKYVKLRTISIFIASIFIPIFTVSGAFIALVILLNPNDS